MLVSGLILLCLAGTGLTWWNYSQHVYSSAEGIVLAAQWPESRIAVEFPEAEAKEILVGHKARITVGKDPKVLQGEVVSITPNKAETSAIEGAMGVTATREASGSVEAVVAGEAISPKGTSTVIVRVLDDPAQQTPQNSKAQQAQQVPSTQPDATHKSESCQHYLLTGAQCSVTIDTTVPPFTSSSSTAKSAAPSVSNPAPPSAK